MNFLAQASYKDKAILGYAYDFNQTWLVQVDFQSGAENSSRHRVHVQHDPRFPDKSHLVR